jgi:hypothetical protein
MNPREAGRRVLFAGVACGAVAGLYLLREPLSRLEPPQVGYSDTGRCYLKKGEVNISPDTGPLGVLGADYGRKHLAYSVYVSAPTSNLADAAGNTPWCIEINGKTMADRYLTLPDGQVRAEKFAGEILNNPGKVVDIPTDDMRDMLGYPETPAARDGKISLRDFEVLGLKILLAAAGTGGLVTESTAFLKKYVDRREKEQRDEVANQKVRDLARFRDVLHDLGADETTASAHVAELGAVWDNPEKREQLEKEIRKKECALTRKARREIFGSN